MKESAETDTDRLATALSHHRAGRLSDAEALYRTILASDHENAEALHLLGLLAQQTGHAPDAVNLIGRAIAIRPDAAVYHCNLGVALKSIGRLDEAVAAYDAAIRADPGCAEAFANKASALIDLGRFEEAAAAARTGIALNRRHADAHYNLGIALWKLDRPEDAVFAALNAVILNPTLARAHSNLGAILRNLGRPAEALIPLARAIELEPTYAEAHQNMAITLLLVGDLATGWAEYEWRWQVEANKMRLTYDKPRWTGGDLDGRTILLAGEQGLGDTIQFSRYASLVAARGARVVLEARRPLLRLLSTVAGVAELVVTDEPRPAYDLYCPLMSLPGAFGTTIETIPGAVPYLTAEPDLVTRWRQRLGTSGFKVGITWQGDPASPVEHGRSGPLALFHALGSVPGVRLISLQKRHGLEQLEQLPDGMHVETLDPDFDEGPDAFVDTAAAMMSLDLVVTVDTAICHLAGALGRPVWIALRSDPHWVWMLDRKDSPWYPTARLFRQRARGDWAGVFSRMARDLDRLVQKQKRPRREPRA